ncbi:MAG: polymer-forming cytoskeletal protein [Bacteroidota bacterium]
MSKNNTVIESNAINMIGSGTTITGNIISENDIRIDGSLNGNLNTKGKLVIGQTGCIQGEIQCNSADVSGKIDGKISVSELLTLKETAKIYGDMKTNKLAIEPNAIFTGTCNMGGNTPEINYGRKPEISGETTEE